MMRENQRQKMKQSDKSSKCTLTHNPKPTLLNSIQTLLEAHLDLDLEEPEELERDLE